jgi:hypothetical protein
MKNPKPYCIDRKNFKFFVLGADPTNFTNDKKPKQLEYAFGINSGDTRYFNGILNNLSLVGLQLEDLYVQNVVPEYLEEETSKNKNWEKKADEWLPILKQELDTIDPKKKKPAFVTAERIMKILVSDGYKLPKASEIYSEEVLNLIYLKPENNKLGRPLIALYRHPIYNLKGKRHYIELIKKMAFFK